MKGRRWFLSLICYAALVGLLGSGLAGLNGGEKDKTAENNRRAEKDKTGPRDQVTGYVWKGFDREFFQKLETTTTQTLVVRDQKIKQMQKQVFYVRWTPRGKDGENHVVEQRIQGVEMLIDIGGNKIVYNSEVKDTPRNPMSEFFNSLKDAFLVYKISPTLEIIDIEKRKELIARLSASKPQMKALLETLLSKETLMQMAQPTWDAFPPARRDRNEWSKTTTLALGNLGTYINTLSYAIDNTEPNRIAITAKLKYKAPGDVEGGSRLPFTIKSADTKDMKAGGTGTATWDRDAGRFSRITMNTSIENLRLTIEVGNTDTNMVLNQTQTSEIRTDSVTFLGRKDR